MTESVVEFVFCVFFLKAANSSMVRRPFTASMATLALSCDVN